MRKNLYILILLLISSIGIASAQLNLKKVFGRLNNTPSEQPTEVKKIDYYSSGKTYYVNASIAKGDGLSPNTALNSLQKAINLAENGSTIKVAAGNYFEEGLNNNGKYLRIYGGYSADFSERDFTKYITKIQPSNKVKSIGKPLFTLTTSKVNFEAESVLNGFVFDLGEWSIYNSIACENDKKGLLSGKLIEKNVQTTCSTIGCSSEEVIALNINVCGHTVIENNVFVNCKKYGIQGKSIEGLIDIRNNVFVACRYAACEITGTADKEDKTQLNFHHNTVLFTWTKSSATEEFGQGFRYMNGIRKINVYNNIFACNSRCAVERKQIESSRSLEKLKENSLYDNCFFANKYDLEVYRDGKILAFPPSRIVDAEEIAPKYSGNKEFVYNEIFFAAIDKNYLKYFLYSNMKNKVENANVKQVCTSLGIADTKISKNPMFANKYPVDKALKLFGVGGTYGAQGK